MTPHDMHKQPIVAEEEIWVTHQVAHHLGALFPPCGGTAATRAHRSTGEPKDLE